MDGFRQRQFVGALVACVNAPTQPTYGLLQSRLVNRGVHGDLFFMHRGGGACAVGAFASFQHVALDFDAQELADAMVFGDLLGGRLSVFDALQTGLPLLARV